ncbi:MAG: Fic family protein [Candidatus ainarchaeum sp.]|nr:Fic family protein [Candidatus ainarchaeum sp.]
MATKWDCLFALVGLKEASLGPIAHGAGTSPSSARQRLLTLVDDGLVYQEGSAYKPEWDNAAVGRISNIMSFCKEKGIDYNLFLTLEFAKIVRIGASAERVSLADFQGISYATVHKYIEYLVRMELVLVVSKKPLLLKFAHHAVFDEVLELFGMKRERRRGARPADAQIYREIEYLFEHYAKTRKDMNLSMAEKNRKVEYAWASAQLSGSQLTFDEAKELVLRDIVPQGKKMGELSMVVNCLISLEYMLKYIEEPLSPGLVLELHRISSFGLGSESFRSAQGASEGQLFRAAAPQEIVPKLERLCQDANEFLSGKRSVQEIVEFSTFVHSEFQHIMPFTDGNARVARLLWNYILIRSEFPLIIIHPNNREEYLSLTKLAREREDEKLNLFFSSTIIDNMRRIEKA